MSIVEELASDISKVAITTFKDNSAEAIREGVSFVQNIEPDLVEWGKLYADGQMSKDEFESLVRGKKDLAELKSLKRKGLAKIMLDKFTDDVLGIVIKRFIK